MKKALTVLLLVLSFMLFFVACNDNMVTSNELIVLGKGISSEKDFEDWSNRGGRAYLTKDLVLYNSYDFSDVLNPNCILDLKGHKLTFGNPADAPAGILVQDEPTKKAKKTSVAKVTVSSTVKLEIKSTDDSGASVPAQIEVKQDTTVSQDKQGTLIINQGGEVKLEGVSVSNEGGAPLLANTDGGKMDIKDSELKSSPTDSTSPSNLIMADSGEVKLEGETKAETGTTVINIVNNVNIFMEKGEDAEVPIDPEKAPKVILEDAKIQNTDPKSLDTVISNKNKGAEVKFEGNSGIEIPAGGNSFYEISSGEVTLEDASFRMQQGTALRVYGDAKLTLKNSTIVNTSQLDSKRYPAILVEENGQLVLEGCWVLSDGTAIEVNSTTTATSLFTTDTDIYSRAGSSEYLSEKDGFADIKKEDLKAVDTGARPDKVESAAESLLYVNNATVSINNAVLSTQAKGLVTGKTAKISFGGEMSVVNTTSTDFILNLSNSEFAESCENLLEFADSQKTAFVLDNSKVTLDKASITSVTEGAVKATADSSVNFTNVKIEAKAGNAVETSDSDINFEDVDVNAKAGISINASNSVLCVAGGIVKSDTADVFNLVNSVFTTMSDLTIAAKTTAIKAVNTTFTNLDSVTTVATSDGSTDVFAVTAIDAKNCSFTTISDCVFASTSEVIKLDNSTIRYIGHTDEVKDGDTTIRSTGASANSGAVVLTTGSIISSMKNEAVKNSNGKGFVLTNASSITSADSVKVTSASTALDVSLPVSSAKFANSDFEVFKKSKVGVDGFVSGDEGKAVYVHNNGVVTLENCKARAEQYAVYVENTTNTNYPVQLVDGSYTSVNKYTACSPITVVSGNVYLYSTEENGGINLKSEKSDAVSAITVTGGNLFTGEGTVVNTFGATSMGMEYYIDVAGNGRAYLGDQTEFWGVEGQQHLHTGALHNDGWYNYYYWLSYAKPTVSTGTVTETEVYNSLKMDISRIGEVGLSAGFGPVSASYYKVISLSGKIKGSIGANSESSSVSKVVGWKETQHSVTERHDGQFQLSADLSKHYFKVDVGYDNDYKEGTTFTDFAKIVTYKTTPSDGNINGKVKVSSYWYTIDTDGLLGNSGKTYNSAKGLYTFVGADNGGHFCTGAVSCTFNNSTANYAYDSQKGGWYVLKTDKVGVPKITVVTQKDQTQKIQLSSDSTTAVIYYQLNGTGNYKKYSSSTDIEITGDIKVKAFALVYTSGKFKDEIDETTANSILNTQANDGKVDTVSFRRSELLDDTAKFLTLKAPVIKLTEGWMLNLTNENEGGSVEYSITYDSKTTSPTSYGGPVDLTEIKELNFDSLDKITVKATAKKTGYPDASTSTNFVRYPLAETAYQISIDSEISDQKITITSTDLGSNPWLYYKLNGAVTREAVPVDFAGKSYEVGVKTATSGTDTVCTVNAFVTVDGYLPSNTVSKTFTKLATPVVAFSSDFTSGTDNADNYFEVTNAPADATVWYLTNSDLSYVKYTSKTALGADDEIEVVFTKAGSISSDVCDTKPENFDVYATVENGQLVVTGTDYASVTKSQYKIVELASTTSRTDLDNGEVATPTDMLNQWITDFDATTNLKLMPGDKVTLIVAGNGKFYSKIEEYTLQ